MFADAVDHAGRPLDLLHGRSVTVLLAGVQINYS
jgi:hypothetical protein